MNKDCIGELYQIQCYKHDGQVHRAWDEAILLDIKEDYMVFGNSYTLVTEAGGNSWRTREPAIMYFFRHEWFNVITQLKKEGTTYYCNIATPFVIEDKTIKYIDYDLDLRIFADGTYKILDKMEYQYHKKEMHYSDEIDQIVNQTMNDLIAMYEQKSPVFDEQTNLDYYKKYKLYKKALRKAENG